jgi:hypothetical protein
VGMNVCINGSPVYHKITSLSDLGYSTQTKDINGKNYTNWTRIKFNYRVHRNGGVIRNAEYNSYNNGCVYAYVDNTTNPPK